VVHKDIAQVHDDSVTRPTMANKKKPNRHKPRYLSGPQSPDREDSPLKAHFRKSGILFGLSQDAVAERLRRLLGPERFGEWQEINYAKTQGASIGEEYGLIETQEELTTLFSLQADISLKVAECINRAVASAYSQGQRLLDLGCGSGILAAWFAAQYPASEVMGCDALASMIKVAQSSQSQPNLRFTQWDYRKPPDASLGTFDILLTSFGVDFPTGRRAKNPLTLGTLKTGDHYKETKEFLAPYFKQWRAAANSCASLYAVLRIPDETMFLAAVDAAHEARWEFDFGASDSVSCNNEHFPSLVFRASDAIGNLPIERNVRAVWLQRQLKAQCAMPWKDSVATCLFESLSGKEILKEESNTYSDGHTMRAIVGRTPDFAFQFAHATTGFARLLLLPISQAAVAEPRFEWGEFMSVDELLW
jgi:SAM-dependent methyltransferase